MTSRTYNKAKGAKAENDIAAWLRRHGYPDADRRPRNGRNDRGDIGGVPNVVIEVKNTASYAGELAGWLTEAETERQNAGADLGFVWHKRKGTSDPGHWYVTMTGETAGILMRAFSRYQNSSNVP